MESLTEIWFEIQNVIVREQQETNQLHFDIELHKSLLESAYYKSSTYGFSKKEGFCCKEYAKKRRNVHCAENVQIQIGEKKQP